MQLSFEAQLREAWKGQVDYARVSFKEWVRIAADDMRHPMQSACAQFLAAPHEIASLTSEQFKQCHKLRVAYGRGVETFIITRIGRINYAVGIENGYAYTRPQLIEKYKNVVATFAEAIIL